jgi:hypothetical protein
MSIVTNTVTNPTGLLYLRASSFKLGGNVVFYNLNQNDLRAQCTLGSSALSFQYISFRDLASAGIDVERQGSVAPRLPPTGVRPATLGAQFALNGRDGNRITICARDHVPFIV